MNNKFITLILLSLLIHYNNSITAKSKKMSTKSKTKIKYMDPETFRLFKDVRAQALPNSGYLFYGYNAVYGNPRSLKSSIDPGFTNPIFITDYSTDNLTGDLRYKIPNGSIFGKNVGCDIKMQTSVIKDCATYKNSISQDVKIGGEFLFFYF